ncbi:MAG: hypothetical protein ACLQU0_00655 [Syntrophobacteraceae bacterium]
MFRRVVRAAFGPALGNLKVVFRRVVRAAFGPALGNLKVVFRRVVRATEQKLFSPPWKAALQLCEEGLPGLP